MGIDAQSYSARTSNHEPRTGGPLPRKMNHRKTFVVAWSRLTSPGGSPFFLAGLFPLTDRLPVGP